MAKLTGGAEHGGCTVSGRILNAGGAASVMDVVLRPARGAFYRGVWYPDEETTVRVGPDGCWSATLVPSRFVGPYVVRIGRARFEMQVPEAESALFGAIATPSAR